MIAKIAAAIALLGMLAGCAGWAPHLSQDSMQDPPIYTGVND